MPKTRAAALRSRSRVFGTAGYSAARLEDIAADVGIKRSSLLYHFDSKQALYTAVLARAFTELERSVHTTMGSADSFEARHKRLVDGLIAFEQQHRPLLQVLMRSLLDHDATGTALVERSFVPLVDRIEQFMRDGMGDTLLVDFPIRAAILQQIVGHLARSAMGPIGDILWRGDAQTWTLTQALLRGATHKP